MPLLYFKTSAVAILAQAAARGNCRGSGLQLPHGALRRIKRQEENWCDHKGCVLLWSAFGHLPASSHFGVQASWRGANPGKKRGRGKGKGKGKTKSFEQTCFTGDLGSVETEEPSVGSSNKWKDEGEEVLALTRYVGIVHGYIRSDVFFVVDHAGPPAHLYANVEGGSKVTYLAAGFPKKGIMKGGAVGEEGKGWTSGTIPHTGRIVAGIDATRFSLMHGSAGRCIAFDVMSGDFN